MRPRGRCWPWSHQWFLRLDDWRVLCTECGAVKHERRRPVHRASRVLIVPSSRELDIIKEDHHMDKLLVYAKPVVAAVGTVVTLVQAALVDQAIWTAVLAAVTVAAVWWIPNKPAA